MVQANTQSFRLPLPYAQTFTTAHGAQRLHSTSPSHFTGQSPTVRVHVRQAWLCKTQGLPAEPGPCHALPVGTVSCGRSSHLIRLGGRQDGHVALRRLRGADTSGFRLTQTEHPPHRLLTTSRVSSHLPYTCCAFIKPVNTAYLNYESTEMSQKHPSVSNANCTSPTNSLLAGTG